MSAFEDGLNPCPCPPAVIELLARPQLAIQATRDYANGLIGAAARDAARDAAQGKVILDYAYGEPAS